MNLPRRQHFIPKFLLNNFASRKNGDEVFVWMFRRGISPKEVNTRNLAQERDFYGHPDLSELEFRIGEHESDFAPIVERLREGDLGNCDFELIRNYIVHLMIRTKHVRLAWIIHQGSSQKRKDALKGMMNTGFADPAFPFGASIT